MSNQETIGAPKIVHEDANYYNNIAISYEKNHDFDKAIYFYKKAIATDVTCVKAYNNIGVVLYKQGRYGAASEIFKMALGVDPSYISTYVNLGAALNKMKAYAQAEQTLLDALKLDSNNAGACANLGNVYNKMKRHHDAHVYHQKALTRGPKSASNHANIGITYKNLALYYKAKEALENAVLIDPHFVNAHFDLSTTYLLLGEYERGFAEYEWRFKKEEMRSLLKEASMILQKPRFTLESPTHQRTLLLYSEQGFGDILQFVRFAPLLKAQFPTLKIVIHVRPELKSLLSSMTCFDAVIARGESLGDFDYQLAAMSLPHLLGVTLESLPQVPYIKMPQGEIDFEADTKKLSIGIVWGASNTGESYADKVFSLRYFLPLIKERHVQLYSLQVGGDAKEIKALGVEKEIIDLEEKLTDFSQTALAMKKLDLIITSDTSVAHLAGALGKKAWVLLQKNPDWRWGLEEERTRWYPTLTLIRQEKSGNWESAFKKVYHMIKERQI